MRPTCEVDRAPHLSLQRIVRPSPLVDLLAQIVIQRSVSGNSSDERHGWRQRMEERYGVAIHLPGASESGPIEIVRRRPRRSRREPLRE